jgi:hypothetical protein
VTVENPVFDPPIVRAGVPPGAVAEKTRML